MSEDVRLPKFMRGDRVKSLDTGEGWLTIQRVIPYQMNAEITLFNYELTGGIIIGEESITEIMEDGEF